MPFFYDMLMGLLSREGVIGTADDTSEEEELDDDDSISDNEPSSDPEQHSGFSHKPIHLNPQDEISYRAHRVGHLSMIAWFNILSY